LTVLPDLSVLASGENPANDTYTFVAETDLTGITGLRLEALPDPSLPNNGPGRCPVAPPFLGGNFTVHEFSVAAGPVDAPGRAVAVPLIRAAAGFSSPHSATLLGGARAMIDGKPDTFWDIHPEMGRPHTAWFGTAKPVGAAGRTRLTIRIDFLYGSPHALGRLRLAVGTSPHSPLAHLWRERTAGGAVGGWASLGAAHFFRGEGEAARAALRRAVEGPDRGATDDWLLLSLVCARLGRMEESRLAYDRAKARMRQEYVRDDQRRQAEELRALLGP
jgi:hypothetical protein